MEATCIAHTGSGAWQALPQVLEALRRRFGRLALYPVSEPGEARELAAALARDCELLVVFGGDGTVHEWSTACRSPAPQRCRRWRWFLLAPATTS
jgi:diacylglycerol kinase family enzyme